MDSALPYGKDLAKYNLELIAFKKHKDTLAYFNKNYVHGGKFPSEIGRAVEKAAKICHASDYDEFYVASKEEASRQIDTARNLIALVEGLCRKKLQIRVRR